MQFGGLGLLVTTVLTLRLLGRQISLVDRLAVSSSLGLASPRAILQVLGRTVTLMLIVEGIGALILWLHWRENGIVTTGDVAFYAVFHVVAAFCNAGFDLFTGLPQYLEGLPSDPITLLTLGWLVMAGTWLLLLTQPLAFSPALFEVVSAFSTTGLSLGVTGELDGFGRLVIIVLMFWGRLGAITIMLALLKRREHDSLATYPEETVLVG